MKEKNLIKTIQLLKKKNLTDEQSFELESLLNNRTEEIKALNFFFNLYNEFENNLFYAREWRKPLMIKSFTKWVKILEQHLNKILRTKTTTLQNMLFHFQAYKEAQLTIFQDEEDSIISITDYQAECWQKYIDILIFELEQTGYYN